MQLTILSGTPGIAVGVAMSQRKRTLSYPGAGNPPSCDRDAIISRLEALLSQTTTATVLDPILTRPAVADALSSVRHELDHLLSLPLHSFLSVQGDHTPLTTPTSFYWHSCYHPSCVPVSECLGTYSKLQTTVSTLDYQSLSDTDQVFAVFNSVAKSGLDLAGLRLVYGEPSSFLDSSASSSSAGSASTSIGPSSLTLAAAVRGPDAIYRWMDVVGPEDSTLARLTDPSSLSAVFGKPGCSLVYCVRTPYRAPAAIAKWFGGRACVKTGSVLGVSDPHTKSERRKRQRVRFSESESEDSLPSPITDVSFPSLVSNRPLLVAPPYSKIFLVVSPHVPPCCYSSVLGTCGTMGYDLFGLKRVRLNSKRASVLGISPSYIGHFTPSSTPSSPSDDSLTPPVLVAEHAANVPPLPSLLLILARENALLHADALKQAVLSDLTALGVQNPWITSHWTQPPDPNLPDAFLHAAPYSEDPFKYIGAFATTPSPSTTMQRLANGWDSQDPSREELSFVAVTQTDSLKKLLQVLEVVYGVRLPGLEEAGRSNDHQLGREREGEGEGGFELLAVKFIPQLSRFHAKQLCPLTPSDQFHHPAVLHLTDSPATIFIFRGINCNQRLNKLLTPSSSSPLHAASLERNLGVIVASSFPEAFRLSTVFFSDKELFCDAANWPLLPCIPPSLIQDTEILRNYQHEPVNFLSVFTVQRAQSRLLVKVLEKLHRAGFHFIAMTTTYSDSGETDEAVLEAERNVSS